jgi:glucan biosynthesis protein C
VLWLLGLVSLVSPVVSALLPGIFYNDLLGIGSLRNMLHYLPFYLFGLWLFSDEELQREFVRVRSWHVLLFAATVAAVHLTHAEDGALWRKVVYYYASGLMDWLATLFCFALFKRLCDRPSRLFFYLSDASYTIYLFHHICTVGFAFLLTRWAGPIGIKFVLIVLAVTTVTVSIHHFLILRFDALRLMFNGKRNPAS